MVKLPRRRIDPNLTPEQREARITELRQRRRARAKTIARRSAFTTLGLILLGLVLGWWLLTTLAGREFLLAQIVARLPQGTTLTWQRAEGPVSGPLVLHGVHFSMPRQRDPECVPTDTASCAMGTIVFDARRVMIDPALAPLLGRTLRLDALQIEGAVLKLPRSDTPFELPRWPEVLPQIAPPLAIAAADVRVNDLRVFSETEVADQYELLIDIERLRGGLLARPGALHVEQLQVLSNRGRFTAHGDYTPQDNYRSDLTVTALLPDHGAGRAPLGLVMRGDLSEMHVALAGRAPGPLRGNLVLRGTENPRWNLQVNAQALDPGMFAATGTGEAGEPLAVQLSAQGTGGDAQFQGRLERGDLVATILPSRMRIADQVLTLQPLALQTLGGRIRARGRADFNDTGNTRFKFAVDASDLQWGGASDAAPAIHADAALGIAGTLEHWAAIGNAVLTRADSAAQLRFDLRGDIDGARIRQLQARTPGGSLDVSGRMHWAPALGWDVTATLSGFDPGYFAAGWDGAIDGQLQSQAQTRSDGGLDIRVDAPELGGRLRGRALSGSGRFVMHGAATAGGRADYAGELALRLGDSRIEAAGEVADRIDIRARFTPLRLADLLPDAAGSLRGSVQVDGPRAAPRLQADLSGSGLSYAGHQAQSLSLRGAMPWTGDGGNLVLRASDVQLGVALDTLRIDAQGAVEDLQLDARAEGPLGTLALSGNLDRSGAYWQGGLASLQLDPAQGAQWRLQQAAAFTWHPDTQRGTLAPACLASSIGGSLCVSADWPRPGLRVVGQGLPLSLARAWLPEREGLGEDTRPWLLRGQLAIDALLRPAGNGWQGYIEVTSPGGGLKFSAQATRELVSYSDLRLRADLAPGGIDAQLHAALNDDGSIDAQLATGWNASAPLSGSLQLDTDELTWLELFSPDIVAPQGRLSARVALSGTRAQPGIAGSAQLTGFTTEIPALAIVLRDGNLQLTAQADGSARISGSVRSVASADSDEGGLLRIDGSLDWRDQSVPLVLQVRGDRVLVSDTLELHAVASPDLTIRVPGDASTEVTGTVTVPEARIDLERLDRGVSVSPDVVVLDPVDPQAGETPAGLALDLQLVLGDDVTLSGFGLDGTLDGQLQVRARPEREMRASGRLEVSGEYSAYGQELQITSGALVWSNDPIDDPLLDIRAVREVGDVTAGVDISGRASAPRARVWSDPASSQSEALAYLTLGRPLSSLSGNERGQLSAASAALTAGGSLLASELGARLGLDDAGVIQSRALGGSVLGVGKQLSPRLYVGYGVSLLGTGQVLVLKYLLDHGFDIEIESSSVENRASLNWRKER